jgi:hypothetical protein
MQSNYAAKTNASSFFDPRHGLAVVYHLDSFGSAMHSTEKYQEARTRAHTSGFDLNPHPKLTNRGSKAESLSERSTVAVQHEQTCRYACSTDQMQRYEFLAVAGHDFA